jgi:uncharacterized protein (DUF2252 family)
MSAKTQLKTHESPDSAQMVEGHEVHDRIDHVTRLEAEAHGREARSAVPRSSHGNWEPAAGRRSAVEILAEQAKSREPDLVPIRHGRMLVSPFTFYRGAAAIMAEDLGPTPASGIGCQMCGDAHLLNFGGYASPERDLVFDVNDFDETLPGPWEWDVKRLTASLVVAGRGAGLTADQTRQAVLATVSQYRDAMRDFASRSELEVWYAKLDEAILVERVRQEMGNKGAPNLQKTLVKARSKDHMKAFSKLTTVVDGEPRIVGDPPLIVPLRDIANRTGASDLETRLPELFREYRASLQPDRRHLLEQYRLVDVAMKVVGVGSVGTRCWIGLLMGRDDSDPMFLQFKEAQDSVLAPFAGKSEVDNQGERVVNGQRMMQATSYIFLGWFRTIGIDGNQRDFYVRQLWDWKVSADPATITSSNLGGYGRLCSWTLARAHARSGDRIAIASYLGKSSVFDEAIASFSEKYADQNERDYAEFADAVRKGVLPVEEGI